MRWRQCVIMEPINGNDSERRLLRSVSYEIILLGNA
jgi:hypothetical protein